MKGEKLLKVFFILRRVTSDAPFFNYIYPFLMVLFPQKYDKRDDFDFDIVGFPFLDGDVPRRPSYGMYISRLIRFDRVCSHEEDFKMLL